jgi:hypothetical protein
MGYYAQWVDITIALRSKQVPNLPKIHAKGTFPTVDAPKLFKPEHTLAGTLRSIIRLLSINPKYLASITDTGIVLAR